MAHAHTPCALFQQNPKDNARYITTLIKKLVNAIYK